MAQAVEVSRTDKKLHAFTPHARVAALTAAISLASLVIVLVLPHGTDIDRGHLRTVAILAVAFALSERLAFHLEARSEAVTYAPTEIGLAIGLVFLFPLELLIARLLGALLGLVISRRPPLFKLVFNLAHFALETLLAVAVFSALTALSDRLWVTGIALLIGVLIALISGGVLVATAISQFEGDLGARIRRELSNAPVLHLPPAVLATSIAVSMTVDPWLGLVAAAPAPMMWVIIRSHGALMHRFSDLTSVHDFSRAVGDATDLREIATAAADRMADASRAARVAVRLWNADGVAVDAAAGPPIAARALPRSPTDRTWVPLLSSRETQRLDADSEPTSHGSALRKAGIEHCLVAAVADVSGPLGVVVVADREGVSTTFDDDDLERLDALVQQLAIVVRKSRFHSQIEYEAAHDRLTELPNRSYFEAWTDQSVSAEHEGAVLLIDLDRFKEINDAFGHHAGDVVLIETAKRIRSACGPADLPARFGGDEFAVLAPNIDLTQATLLAETISASLEQPFDIGPATVAIGASVGIAVFPEHAQDATGLLRRADIAMYDAKTRRTRSSVYRDDLEESDSTRLTLLADLRAALQHRTLDVHYQPQIDLATGAVIGAEALARWRHPEHGYVNPEVFVGLAEQSGLIEELTRQVLAKSADAASQWQRRGWNLTVSVNISAQSLLDERLEPLVAHALRRSKLEPERLMLEITETTMMGDADRTHRILQGLAQLGIKLSVDDFGTGYSSLANLRHFPVSELKIDRSFILDLMRDHTDDIIVRSTIDLGHNLGLSVVAEGVENAEVQSLLAEFGCDIAQGYGISRPLPHQAFLEWMSAYQNREALEPQSSQVGIG